MTTSRCAWGLVPLLLHLVTAGQVDPRFAKNITVYHVHAQNVSNIPVDMDTGDAPGDLLLSCNVQALCLLLQGVSWDY
eukprot:Skav226440  [mRNA]  locus=scaffold2660:121387:123100:+ [translate_table: standard]